MNELSEAVEANDAGQGLKHVHFLTFSTGPRLRAGASAISRLTPGLRASTVASSRLWLFQFNFQLVKSKLACSSLARCSAAMLCGLLLAWTTQSMAVVAESAGLLDLLQIPGVDENGAEGLELAAKCSARK